MATVADVEKLALDLPEADRAALVARLTATLPPPADDDAEEIAEALRRDAELEANPGIAMTLEQLDENVRKLLA